MKLLFDNNLSPRLAARLADIFPGSVHLSHLGMSRSEDLTVFLYARTQGFLIATQDNDFAGLVAARGFPPHVIHLRGGNSTTLAREQTLRNARAAIYEWESERQTGVLVLEE